MTHRFGYILLALCAAGLLISWMPGCSIPANPWRFTDPPTRGAVRADGANTSPMAVVIVDRFDDPSRAPNYSQGVGKAMSDAFSRALIREGYEVRINKRIAGEARQYARFDSFTSTAMSANDELSPQQQQARERLKRDRAEADYVVIGKVTDFYHTRDLPEEASRRGLIGRRNEAIVSFDLRVVDMHTMQVVGTDHLMGTANAGRTRSHELYENVSLDSYVFWNTPLGRAGRRAIDRAVSRATAMMPADHRDRPPPLVEADTAESSNDAQVEHVDLAAIDKSASPQRRPSRFANARPQILRVDDSRRLTIMGGRNIGVVQGDRFHIARDAGAVTSDTLVKDPVTRQPIRIAITEVAETTSIGWLLGQKPRQLDLRGMLLHLPEEYVLPAAAQADAASASESR